MFSTGRIWKIWDEPVEGWCDDCMVSSLYRSYFIVQIGRQLGVARSEPICSKCHKVLV